MRGPALLLCLILAAARLAGGDKDIPPALRPYTTPGLTVDVRLGLGGARTMFLPTPLVLTADNRTGERIDAAWEVGAINDPQTGATEVLARRPLALVNASILRTRLAPALGDRGLVVRLRQGERLLYQQAFPALSAGASSYDPSHLTLLVGAPQALTLSAPPGRAIRIMPNAQNPDLPALGERAMNNFSASAWELPTTAQPLFAFHALLVSSQARCGELTPAMAQSLADYVRWGGCLILPVSAQDWLETVAAAWPPAVQARLRQALQDGVTDLTQVPVFTGSVILTRADLLEGDRPALAEQILARLERGEEPSLPRHLCLAASSQGLPTNATYTLFVVGGLFVLYALVTGPLVWLLLRRARRRVLGWYAAITIALFSALTSMLGPMLSLQPGDLEWLTVTEPSPDGGVQWGLLTLTSAGGRAYELALQGQDARGWLLPRDLLYGGRNLLPHYYWTYQASSPFARETSLAFDPDACALGPGRQRLAIPPWGKRLLRATATAPGVTPLEVSVRLQSNRTLRVDVRNPTRFAISHAQLVLGAWTVGSSGWNNQKVVQDFYQVIGLGEILPASSAAASTPLALGQVYRQMLQNLHAGGWDRDMEIRTGLASRFLPPVHAKGCLWGALIGQVQRSPGVQPSQAHFRVYNGLHFIVQPLRPEDLPAPAETAPLLPTATPAAEAQ